MTSKAESLLVAFEECNTGLDADYARQKIVCYIEDLERKAAAYDNLDATAEAMCRMSVGELQRKLAELQRASGIPASERGE